MKNSNQIFVMQCDQNLSSKEALQLFVNLYETAGKCACIWHDSDLKPQHLHIALNR